MYNYSLHKYLEKYHHFAGNAWGIRKELYKEIEYIIDTCIGSLCDYSYALASMKNIDDWDGLDYVNSYK